MSGIFYHAHKRLSFWTESKDDKSVGSTRPVPQKTGGSMTLPYRLAYMFFRNASIRSRPFFSS